MYVFFFFKQKTAYEMRISDWSSDVCSSDLARDPAHVEVSASPGCHRGEAVQDSLQPDDGQSSALRGMRVPEAAMLCRSSAACRVHRRLLLPVRSKAAYRVRRRSREAPRPGEPSRRVPITWNGTGQKSGR